MQDRTMGSAQRHAPGTRAEQGFTVVELIMVILLAGILAAVAASRFYNRTGFDVASFADTARGMVRYAQKLAIAQNRTVWVTGTVDPKNVYNVQGIGLCYSNNATCPTADQVQAPSGTNSGNANTRYICVVGGAYVPSWYCESAPSAGLTMKLATGSFAPFYFNGLGKPFALDANNKPVPFPTTQYKFSGDNATIAVTVYQETGYVE
jgi:MSHA pilin protein MshC